MNLYNLTDKQYQDYANRYVKNWAKAECFNWYGEPEDSENWALYYTSNRDSELLEQANEKVILQHFKDKFKKTQNLNWCLERHNHFLCGYCDCISIRVYKKNGKITREFKELAKIIDKLENDYPILDENIYSEMEYEATCENIDMEAYSLKSQYNLPEDWMWYVFQYWDEKDSNKLENVDDRGGWLDRSDIELALKEKGIIKDEIEVN
jgi:hypothetical protein